MELKKTFTILSPDLKYHSLFSSKLIYQYISNVNYQFTEKIDQFEISIENMDYFWSRSHFIKIQEYGVFYFDVLSKTKQLLEYNTQQAHTLTFNAFVAYDIDLNPYEWLIFQTMRMDGSCLLKDENELDNLFFLFCNDENKQGMK